MNPPLPRVTHPGLSKIAPPQPVAATAHLRADLGRRIAELRKTISSTEAKRRNIDDALATRKAALNRLLAAAALHGAGTAPSDHE